MKVSYIVIDGPEGCGKSTQIGLLAERATHDNHIYKLTREPGGTSFSAALREVFLSEVGKNISAVTQFMMMWAQRRDHLKKVVWPALEKNVPVFSDRGDSSTFAYQVYGSGVLFLKDDFWRLRELIFAGRTPTLYIYLEMPPVLARSRAVEDKLRGNPSYFDTKPVTFYDNVCEGFRVFGDTPGVKMVTVDANRSKEEVHKDIYRIVSEECKW